MLRALAVLLLLVSVALAAPVPKAVKKAKSMDGRWKLIEQNVNGRDDPNFNKWMWVIDGEELSYRRPDGQGVYQPEDTGSKSALVRPNDGQPGEMDWQYGVGKGGIVYSARVHLDGDELIVCIGSGGNRTQRPAEAKPGPNVQFFRFKRVDSDK